MKRLFMVSAFALAIAPLCACSSLAPVIHQATTQTPVQIKTLAEAEQAATLATRAASIYVTTAHPSKEQAVKIGQLSDAVHTELVKLEEARKAGRSLAFTAFNSALAALNAFSATR